MDELTREECLRLLAARPIGRLAVVTAEGLPMIVPVNYVLDGDTVLFRTDAGTKVDGLRRHPVAFEVDDIDPDDRTGWSVLVQGIAHEVAPEEVGRAAVHPWAGGEKRQWVRIVPRSISGRRLTSEVMDRRRETGQSWDP